MAKQRENNDRNARRNGPERGVNENAQVQYEFADETLSATENNKEEANNNDNNGCRDE